jgi:hypothetical protein
VPWGEGAYHLPIGENITVPMEVGCQIRRAAGPCPRIPRSRCRVRRRRPGRLDAHSRREPQSPLPPPSLTTAEGISENIRHLLPARGSYCSSARPLPSVISPEPQTARHLVHLEQHRTNGKRACYAQDTRTFRSRVGGFSSCRRILPSSTTRLPGCSYPSRPTQTTRTPTSSMTATTRRAQPILDCPIPNVHRRLDPWFPRSGGQLARVGMGHGAFCSTTSSPPYRQPGPT